MRHLVMFTAFLVFVALRGVHPVSSPSLALFGPLLLVCGVLLERTWHLVALRRALSQAEAAA